MFPQDLLNLLLDRSSDGLIEFDDFLNLLSDILCLDSGSAIFAVCSRIFQLFDQSESKGPKIFIIILLTNLAEVLS